MSADVTQLIADLRLGRVNILGHSMGGKIAMTLALTQVCVQAFECVVLLQTCFKNLFLNVECWGYASVCSSSEALLDTVKTRRVMHETKRLFQVT